MTEEQIKHLRRLGHFYGDDYGLSGFENMRLFESDFQVIALALNEMIDNNGGPLREDVE